MEADRQGGGRDIRSFLSNPNPDGRVGAKRCRIDGKGGGNSGADAETDDSAGRAGAAGGGSGCARAGGRRGGRNGGAEDTHNDGTYMRPARKKRERFSRLEELEIRDPDRKGAGGTTVTSALRHFKRRTGKKRNITVTRGWNTKEMSSLAP